MLDNFLVISLPAISACVYLFGELLSDLDYGDLFSFCLFWCPSVDSRSLLLDSVTVIVKWFLLKVDFFDTLFSVSRFGDGDSDLNSSFSSFFAGEIFSSFWRMAAEIRS